MLIRQILLILLLLALAHPLAFSQGLQDRVEDVVRWFPRGMYDLIMHEDIEGLEEPLGHGTARHPGRRLPGARALQHVPHVPPVVL